SAVHLLPHDTIVAVDTRVSAWRIAGADFVARDDAETNFRLFAAEAAEAAGVQEEGLPALACTVRPNGDISLAIDSVCGRYGIRDAAVFGVGSLKGVDFADGRHVPSYATEVMVGEGRVSSDGGT